jgi:hypothetical protein
MNKGEIYYFLLVNSFSKITLKPGGFFFIETAFPSNKVISDDIPFIFIMNGIFQKQY